MRQVLENSKPPKSNITLKTKSCRTILPVSKGNTTVMTEKLEYSANGSAQLKKVVTARKKKSNPENRAVTDHDQEKGLFHNVLIDN